jgi:hypothetical protein
MTPQQILSDLTDVGIEISLAGGDLRVSGRHELLTPERRSLIKRHKLQLIAILRRDTTEEGHLSGEPLPYKQYQYPNGRTLTLSREEFYRVVDAVRILLRMHNEQSQDCPKGA